MKIEFDKKKSALNLEKHGVSFSLAVNFDESRAFVFIDKRRQYGEDRYIALVPLPNRLHVMVFKKIRDGIRIISLRKANKREEKIYAEKAAH